MVSVGLEGVARFGAIGDIHAEDHALRVAIDHLRGERRLETILAVGDIVDGRGDANRCIELLRDHDVIAVRGNHERWFLGGEMRDLPDATTELTPDNRAYLEGLPATREFETPVGRMMLCHGVGEDDMAILTPDARGFAIQAALTEVRQRQDVSLFVCGHTHQPMLRTIGPFRFLNVGTLHRDHDPGFVVADLEARRVEFLRIAPDDSLDVVDTVEIPEG